MEKVSKPGTTNFDKHLNKLPKQDSDPKKSTRKPSMIKEDNLALCSMPNNEHPYAKFLRGNWPELNEFKKFVTLFYKGLYYSVNNLKGPSEEFIKKKSVTLPEYVGRT